MTAGDLIASSLRLIGVLASGESSSSSEAGDALSVLNGIINGWSNEQLIIPNKVREVFSLVGAQQTYTMGSGGDFNTTRPQRIENALLRLTTSSPVIELPIKILTKDEYASIAVKTLSSNLPMYLYNDGAYPLDSLSLWPVPSTSSNTLVLYSWKPLTELALLTTSISLPLGYQRALRYALAVELAPEYGKAPSEIVIAVAVESKAGIKRLNHQPNYLTVDAAVRATPSSWNYLTGEPV